MDSNALQTESGRLQKRKLRAAVILDNLEIRAWQLHALHKCSDIVDVQLILNCTNTCNKRHFVRNFFYYIINIFCLKNKETRIKKVDWFPAEIYNFNSIYHGSWQSFPPDVVSKLNGDIDVVIKFGMSLLRVPESLGVKYGILSYHHGDPGEYRGRPAGFYELMDSAKRVGVIVQRLSDVLDGGAIYAMAFSKIYHHSYKQTSENYYKNSAHLLRKAIQNATSGRTIRNTATGKNYRLPSNAVALKFFYVMGVRKLKRLLYAAFIEKKWNVAVTSYPSAELTDKGTKKISLKGAIIPEIQPRYSFYADPFFSSDGSELYVEAMNKYNGWGEIVSLDAATGVLKQVILKGGHYSYPQTVRDGQAEYLFPEAERHSVQQFVSLDKGSFLRAENVSGLERYNIVDATYFSTGGIHYIFASELKDAADNLLLFVSEHRCGPYREHPQNPIVIDPSCARMAGAILTIGDRKFRLGQNYCFGYGEKISVCEIEALSPMEYSERVVSEVEIDAGGRGPHTLNVNSGKIVMDFYSEKSSPFAGVRRVLAVIGDKLRNNSR